MSRPPFAVVILAAGLSSRFGSPKLAAMYRGKPLLSWTVTHALESGAAKIVLVVAPDWSSMNHPLPEGVDCVINPTSRAGLSSSISVGIRSLAPDAEIAVLMLGDQPLVSAEHLRNLVDAVEGETTMAASAYDDNSPGVPAAFHRVHFDRLIQLSGDTGAKALLSEPGAATICLPSASQLDIDTPEDLNS